MQEAFFGFISQFGYLAVAALILFETVIPPIPRELLRPLSGFLATQTEMTLPGDIIAATVGSVVGAYFLYGIGRLLSQERLEGFFDTKPMRMLGFHSDDVDVLADGGDGSHVPPLVRARGCGATPIVCELQVYAPVSLMSRESVGLTAAGAPAPCAPTHPRAPRLPPGAPRSPAPRGFGKTADITSSLRLLGIIVTLEFAA